MWQVWVYGREEPEFFDFSTAGMAMRFLSAMTINSILEVKVIETDEV